MTNKKYQELQNRKHIEERKKEYYELMLYHNGSLVEHVVASKFNQYKGEFERLNAFCERSSSYKLKVNLYNYQHQFEKEIQWKAID